MLALVGPPYSDRAELIAGVGRVANIAEVLDARAGPPYSLCVPQPPAPAPSSLPSMLPAYIDAPDGNIMDPGFVHCIPYPPGIIPPIGAPMPMPIIPIGGTPIAIPLSALTLDPRSHSSFAAASACCATAIWYACFATIIACWCAARYRGSALGGTMNCGGAPSMAAAAGFACAGQGPIIGAAGAKFIMGFTMLMRGPIALSGPSWSSSSASSEMRPLTTFPNYQQTVSLTTIAQTTPPTSIAALASVRLRSFRLSSSLSPAFVPARPCSLSSSSNDTLGGGPCPRLPPRLFTAIALTALFVSE